MFDTNRILLQLFDKRRLLISLMIISLNLYVSAQGGGAIGNLAQKICDIIEPIYEAVLAAATSLVLLMFVYGGAKYAYSADDPGGRKQGKQIVIHSIIAGILLAIASTVLTTVGVNQICANMNAPGAGGGGGAAP